MTSRVKNNKINFNGKTVSIGVDMHIWAPRTHFTSALLKGSAVSISRPLSIPIQP
jgi:hypothetical protein